MTLVAPPSLVQYMRAHGNTPGPTQRPTLAGALTGVLAEIPALLVLWRTEALTSVAHALAVPVAAALPLHAVLMAVSGAVYARLFGRAANDRRGGWLFGVSYGYLLWMLGPVAALQWTLGRPLATGLAAIGLLAAHLAYGLVLGLSYPHVHGRVRRSLDAARAGGIAPSR